MNNRTCAAPGCDRKHYCKGYCTKHYGRFLYRGDGTVEDRKVPTVSEDMEAKTDNTGACWIWKGAIATTGYGQISVDGVRKYAHRVAYELANGLIPEGMRIDHICHTPACVRPDHLRVVTIKQNAENYTGLLPTNTSGVRGVYRQAKTDRWQVQVTHNGQRYSGGGYRDLRDAEAAAIALRNQLHTHNDLDRT